MSLYWSVAPLVLRRGYTCTRHVLRFWSVIKDAIKSGSMRVFRSASIYASSIYGFMLRTGSRENDTFRAGRFEYKDEKGENCRVVGLRLPAGGLLAHVISAGFRAVAICACASTAR